VLDLHSTTQVINTFRLHATVLGKVVLCKSALYYSGNCISRRVSLLPLVYTGTDRSGRYHLHDSLVVREIGSKR
jgi:hypothetical protein